MLQLYTPYLTVVYNHPHQRMICPPAAEHHPISDQSALEQASPGWGRSLGSSTLNPLLSPGSQTARPASFAVLVWCSPRSSHALFTSRAQALSLCPSHRRESCSGSSLGFLSHLGQQSPSPIRPITYPSYNTHEAPVLPPGATNRTHPAGSTSAVKFPTTPPHRRQFSLVADTKKRNEK